MKKLLFITNKESGFILPVVLFVASIVMMIIASHIYMYHHDIQITENQLQQVKVESLFQMSLTLVKQDLPAIEKLPANISYSFPDGEVTVNIVDQGSYKLTFTIQTNESKSNYIITYWL